MNKLEKFLKDNDVYEQFMDNLDYEFEKLTGYYAIHYAFIWKNSSEGHRFWRDIAEKWKEEVRHG